MPIKQADSAGLTVLLVNMGGPATLDAIEPFLLNLFNDPDIIDIPGGRWFRPVLARWIVRRRLPMVRRNYQMIGGGSPILSISQQQARALQRALQGQFPEVEVKLCMRYCSPTVDEVLPTIPKHHHIVVLPLYPHYSRTTTGSSFRQIQQWLSAQGQNGHPPITWIRDYHDHPRFIQSWVETIHHTLEGIPAQHRSGIPLLFSAHGVPQKVITEGDPYQKQIQRCIQLICEQLGQDYPVHLAYQSKVGRARWLSPSTSSMLQKLGAAGVQAVVVIPISFVSENSETLFELDILLRQEARQAGILHYYRVPTLNTHPQFIQALKEVVLEHVREN